MQIQVEVSQLVDEVNRIASHAQFNGMNLLTGAFARTTEVGKPMMLQVGANMDQSESIHIEAMTVAALGLDANENESVSLIEQIGTAEGANAVIGRVDSALRTVSKQRADLGGYQNRFENAAQGVAVAAENLQAAESRIRDTDMAAEMVKYTRDQIMVQAGTAMLAQANVRNQSVLSLLG
jgi:flagellin